MPTARTVLFDLDDTICEYRRDVDEVLDAAFERADVEPFFEANDWAGVIPEIDSADSQAHFRRKSFGLLADRHGRDREHAHAVAEAFGTERDDTDVRFLPGAREALDRLADDHQLGLVTNGAPEMQEPKLASLGIADTFEDVVYAGSETLAKPDPSPFETILDRLEATPDRTFHVGNSLGTDVAGARAAGVGAVWVPRGVEAENGDGHEPDHRLDSLHDLPTVPDLRL